MYPEQISLLGIAADPITKVLGKNHGIGHQTALCRKKVGQIHWVLR